jgi:magnesium-transporting ATPase (P-type)
MSLFKKEENLSEEEKKASVVAFWLFVVVVFAWVIPFTVLFVLQFMKLGIGAALVASLWPSLLTLGVTAVLCVIVYFLYRKLILKL